MANVNEARQAVLVSEDELYSWGTSYAWKLPRRSFPVKRLAARKFTCFSRLNLSVASERKEDWLLAEFEMPPSAGRGSCSVAFSAVKCLYGFSEQHVGFLRGRYGDLGLSVQLAGKVVCEAFDEWWKDARVMAQLPDVADGVRALSEIAGVQTPDDYLELADQIARARLQAEDNVASQQEDFLVSLFRYSRSAVFPCAGALAALCDLGVLLRSRANDDDENVRVSGLLVLVTERLKRPVSNPLTAVREILWAVGDWPECRLEHVLFLSWKYASEQKGGNVDLDQILADLKAVREGGVDETVLRTAVALFGGYVGFKSFATPYHILRRKVRKVGGRFVNEIGVC
jgi:hypothetical protein